MDSSIPFFLRHPLTHNILQALLSVLVLGFTQPNSALRFAAFPFHCLFLLLLFIPPYPIFNSSRILSSLFAANTLGFSFQFFDAAIISRWSFDAQGPTSANGGMLHIVQQDPDASNIEKSRDRSNRTWLKRLEFGFWISLPLSTRLINTPWQVTGTPEFPARRPPSRSQFLQKAFFRLLTCLLVCDLIGALNGKDDPTDKTNQELFNRSRVPLFARLSAITGQEILIRIAMSFFMWFAAACVLQVLYSIMQIVAVGSGLTGVEGWKPLFGSLSDCWSVRQFWGRCWHQSLRLRIANPAHYLIYHLLGFRKGSITGRYAMLMTVFFLSSLFHVAEDAGEGMDWRNSGSLRYFCMQPIGIMLEDAVQAVYRRHSRLEGKAPGHKSWTRIVGYVWFVAWMSWTTPAWIYPKAFMAKGGPEDRILPFSILTSIM